MAPPSPTTLRAGREVLQTSAASTSEEDAEGDSLLDKIPEALRQEIMVEVEAILAKKEESLFRRGQAEIGKLHEERKQVAACLTEITAKQELMVKEHVAMKSALGEITSQLEFLATEMTQVLRSRHVVMFFTARVDSLPRIAKSAPFAAPQFPPKARFTKR